MGRIKSRAARAALGVVAGTLAYGVVASAPAVQDQVGPGPDEGLRSAGVHANVYLHDSFEAEELINKAIRQAGAGRWTQAAQNVRRGVAQHADKLTRIGPG